jgi:hypothetical protein
MRRRDPTFRHGSLIPHAQHGRISGGVARPRQQLRQRQGLRFSVQNCKFLSAALNLFSFRPDKIIAWDIASLGE